MQLSAFLKGNVTQKTKLIILILSTGQYSYDEVRNMTCDQLKAFKPDIPSSFPELRDICDELTASCRSHHRAFTNPSGRPYSIKNIADILIRAHQRADVEYQGREYFAERVRGGREE